MYTTLRTECEHQPAVQAALSNALSGVQMPQLAKLPCNAAPHHLDHLTAVSDAASKAR